MDKRSKIVTDNIHCSVMVCGATGFIGSHLVAQLLQAGYLSVHIISRTINSCTNLEKILKYYGVHDRYDDLNIHYGEISNYKWLVESFEDCQIIFNCASTVDMGAGNGSQLIIDNTTITHLIAEAAIEAKAERIIHVSSIATLAAQKYPMLTTENNYLQSLKNESSYSISKFYSENEMWRIAEKGIDVVVVNPAVVLGYGDLHGGSSTKIIKKIQHHLPFYTSGVTGYVMVEDVARAMILLSDTAKAVGERFILCSNNFSYKEMIYLVSKSLGVRGAYIYVPNWIVSTAGVLFKGLNKVGFQTKFSFSLAKTLVSKHTYDGTKIGSYTDFQYSDTKQAIAAMGEAYTKK